MGWQSDGQVNIGSQRPQVNRQLVTDDSTAIVDANAHADVTVGNRRGLMLADVTNASQGI
jgi:hypothetical protein